jgi:hypothetical protein
VILTPAKTQLKKGSNELEDSQGFVILPASLYCPCPTCVIQVLPSPPNKAPELSPLVTKLTPRKKNKNTFSMG